MSFGEHQTCLLTFLLPARAFFWPLFHKAQLCVRLKVVLWTDNPISALELCSSFRVIFGLFVASLNNALLAWSMSFGGRPSLGRFVGVPESFYVFKIMDLMVLRGMFKDTDTFL